MKLIIATNAIPAAAEAAAAQERYGIALAGSGSGGIIPSILLADYL